MNRFTSWVPGVAVQMAVPALSLTLGALYSAYVGKLTGWDFYDWGPALYQFSVIVLLLIVLLALLLPTLALAQIGPRVVTWAAILLWSSGPIIVAVAWTRWPSAAKLVGP